ncbi:MAG: helix-turn-helix transcriptional regulator [Lachnospiraceae bacterium]|nr:helix-turn-helix transcriptional regulator [Lachnospiraceae bacterium]
MGRIRNQHHNSLLLQYIIQYVSIALLSCAIISMVVASSYVRELQIKERYYTEERMNYVIDDLEQQMEVFSTINLRISISGVYRPQAFTQNKYHEITLVNDLAQYKNYSALCDSFYLYYYGDTRLFNSLASTTDCQAYLDTFSRNDADQLSHLFATPIDTIQILALEKQIVIAFPFHYGALKDQVILCFPVDYAILSNRIQSTGSKLSGTLNLLWNDELIFSNSGTRLSSDDNSVITASRLTNDFTLLYHPDSTLSSMGNFLIPTNILLFSAAIILLILLASLLAYLSYSPIRRLVQHLTRNVTAGEKTEPAPFRSNELKKVDELMQELLDMNRNTSRELERKQSQLRRQLLQLLLNGNYSEPMNVYLQQLDLFFPGPCFFVGSLRLPDCLEQKEAMQLEKHMEAFSDASDSIYIYTFRQEESHHLLLLCSIPTADIQQEIADWVNDLLSSLNYDCTLHYGNVYRSLTKMYASYLEAGNLSNNAMKERSESVLSPSQSFVYDRSWVLHLCTSLSLGDEETAIWQLENHLTAIHADSISLLMLQYMIANFISEVSATASQLDIHIPEQMISLIISSKSSDLFRDAAKSMIHYCCSQVELQKQLLLNDKSLRCMQFMKEHFMDYNLTLESAAEALCISPSDLRTIIKDATGRSYKDYLIYLRIEYAKILLTEKNLSVADTCQQVGYGNISHFIKSFKNQVGQTPAKYRESMLTPTNSVTDQTDS